MPKIPVRGYSERINTQVAGVDIPTANAGAEYKAIADIGNTISQIAIQVQEKKTQLQNDQYVLDKIDEGRKAVETFSEDSRRVDPAGHAERVRQFIQSYQTSAEESAPTEEARLAYARQSNNYFTSVINSEENFATKMQAQEYQVGLLDKIDSLAKDAYKNPLVIAENFKNITAPYVSNIDSQNLNSLSPEMAQKMKNSLNFEVTDKAMKSLLANEKFREAKYILKSESDFKNAMTADQVAKYSNLIDQGVEQKKNKEVALLNKDLGNALYATKFGSVSDKEFKSLEARANAYLEGPEKEVALDSIKSARAVQGVTAGLERTNPNQWPTEPPVTVSSSFNARTRGMLLNQFEARKKGILAERQKDSTDFILRTNPVFAEKYAKVGMVNPLTVNASNVGELSSVQQNFISELMAEKRRLGINDDKVLTNTQAQMFGKTILSDTLTPQASAGIMDKYQAVYGPYFKNVMTQVVAQEKALDNDFLVAAYADTPGKERIISNVRYFKDEKQFQNAKKTFSSRTGIGYDSFTKQVSLELDAHRLGLANQSGESLYNGMVNQVSLEAMRRFNNGEDLQTAKAQAIQTIIDRNFTTVSGGRGQVVTVPKKDGQDIYDADAIKTFLDKSANSFGISNEHSVIGKLNPKPLPGFEGIESEFLPSLIKQQKWLPTPTGLSLNFVDPARGPRQVYNKKGEPIIVPYKDLSAMRAF